MRRFFSGSTKVSNPKHKSAVLFALLLSQTPLQTQLAQANPSPTRSFDSFSELRYQIISLIGASQKRAWLFTKHLSDSETTVSLYMAKYRNLDVKVILDRSMAEQNASSQNATRLRDLRSQNIPVQLLSSFPSPSATALMLDDRLYYVDSPLDHRRTYGKYLLKLAPPAKAREFEKKFLSHWGDSTLNISQKSPTPQIRTEKTESDLWQAPASSSDTYTYSDTKKPRPAGVTNQLPKTPLWQK